MGTYAKLQERQWFYGETTASEDGVIIQDPADWVDCGGYADVFITAKVNSVETAGTETMALCLFTMDKKRTAAKMEDPPDGPLTKVKVFDPVDSGKWYKHLSTLEHASISATENPVERFLFWALSVERKATNGTFGVDFEIDLTLKRPA